MEARAMKNDLTCGVVGDLLPSYVEGLLGEEAREAVERHLEDCPACRAEKEAMAAPAGEAAAEAVKEVDFLRRVKKGTLKKVTLAVICTAAVLLGGAALKLFVIGTPLQPQSVAVTDIRQTDGVLYVSLMSVSSGNAFRGWKVEVEDGVASIYARDVLASPLFHDGGGLVGVSLDLVREVWLGGVSGQLLWKEGLVISTKTQKLLEAKTPYCGDAAAMGRLIDLLEIRQRVGPCTFSLHTSNEPYRLTVEFTEPINVSSGQWKMMRVYLYPLLALVENLDEVEYTYVSNEANGRTNASRVRGGSITAEDASGTLRTLTRAYNDAHGTDWPVKGSIKEYAESLLDYQRMVVVLREGFGYFE